MTLSVDWAVRPQHKHIKKQKNVLTDLRIEPMNVLLPGGLAADRASKPCPEFSEHFYLLLRSQRGLKSRFYVIDLNKSTKKNVVNDGL